MVSFPPLTKIFPFRGFLFLPERNGVPWESVARSLIRVSPDLSLHAATRGISLLAAPFFSAQAWSSTRRRIMSGLLSCSGVCLAWDRALSLCLVFIASKKSSLHPLPLIYVRGCILRGVSVWQFDRQHYLTAVSGNISLAVRCLPKTRVKNWRFSIR